MSFFCPLASGSKGNASILSLAGKKILIDAGISVKQLEEKLAGFDLALDQLDAIFITHEHMDHIAGLKTLSNKYDLPIICNSDTAKGIMDTLHIETNFKLFTKNEAFDFFDLRVFPFTILHDTLDPVAFKISYKDIHLAICTDLGFATSFVINQLHGCNYYYLEANHEVSMVHACSRPQVYKTRVLGRQGHLSNDQTCELLKTFDHRQIKKIYLAHLSDECNAKEAALRKVTSVLTDFVDVDIAHQHKISNPLIF